LLTPTRWLWDEEVFAVGEEKFGLLGLFLRLVRRRLQRWDYIAAQRVDEFICISKEVQDRCFRYYKRESTLIYPYFDETYWQGLITPKSTDTDTFSSTVLVHDKSKGEKCTIHTPYFLVVSRLEIYKRIDLAIHAFKLLQQSKELEGYSLVIVGTGSQARQLRQLAGRDPRIIFLTEVTDRDLAKLYRDAVALVMPQKEDFGYTACEAIACACPVVCFALGGQTEIVENGLQGQHFHEQTPSAIAKSLVQTSKLRYNRDSYENSNIRRWGRDTFVAAFTKKISQTV
jgi:glycosyltransferase involved in cell wall biosynthesis